MRALVLAGLVSLAGCIIDNDRVRVESFRRGYARDLHLRRCRQIP